MGGFSGIARGLGVEGENIENARQRAIREERDRLVDRLAKSADTRATRRQEFDIKTQSQRQAIGDPYRGPDGKTYQRWYSPLDGKVTTEPLEQQPASNFEQFRQDYRAVYGKDPDVETAMHALFKMPYSHIMQGRDAYPDPNSKTGWSRNILDNQSGAVIGVEEAMPPASTLPTEGTREGLVPDAEGHLHKQTFKTTHRKVLPGGASYPGGVQPPGTAAPAAGKRPPATSSHGTGTKNLQNQGARGAGSTPGQVVGGTGAGAPGPIVGHKPLGTVERQTLESTAQLVPAADRILAAIDKYQAQDSNSWGDSVSSFVAWQQYNRFHRLPSNPLRRALIKDIALSQVIGAAPWTKVGRGKYMYEVIKPHLPDPLDTPANLYIKALWLKNNVIPEARKAIYGDGALIDNSYMPAPQLPE